MTIVSAHPGPSTSFFGRPVAPNFGGDWGAFGKFEKLRTMWMLTIRTYKLVLVRGSLVAFIDAICLFLFSSLRGKKFLSRGR